MGNDNEIDGGGDEVCAPNAEYIGDSCIAVEVLESMVEEYNVEKDKTDEPEKKIDLRSVISLKQINPVAYKKVLVKKLRHALKEYCDNQTQTCWVDIPFIQNMKNKKHWQMLEKYTFKPLGPKNTNEWLNTTHINEIFIQYEKVYPEFKFFGAIPRDFDKLNDLKIKGLDFGQLVLNGITKIGFIFNLDTSNMPGSHWVALYSDLKNGDIDYIDSVGDKPAKEFLILMKRIEDYLEKVGVKPIININETQHQHGGSECGVYACSFILRLLRGESFNDISATPIPDAQIKKCRLKYFR